MTDASGVIEYRLSYFWGVLAASLFAGSLMYTFFQHPFNIIIDGCTGPSFVLDACNLMNDIYTFLPAVILGVLGFAALSRAVREKSLAGGS